jgi:type IV fimbrial biogenesis protein FimT
MLRRNAGFTMVELMVTVAVVGIMMYIAVPSLTAFLQDSQLSSDTNDLVASLLLARSESVTRNNTVSICKIDPADLDSCDNSESWQSGWIVFEDLDNDGARDGDEDIIDTYTGMNTNTVVAATNFTNFLTYRPSGATNTQGQFNLCVSSSVAQNIIVNATGRPRIAAGVCP